MLFRTSLINPSLHDQWCYDGNGLVMEPSCVLWTSLQMFCLIPQCILHHSPPCHTWICRSLFCRMVSLALGCTRRSLMVLPPLKNISTPCFLQMFLQLSPMPWMYVSITIKGLITPYPSDHNISHINIIRIIFWLFHLPKHKRLLHHMTSKHSYP